MRKAKEKNETKLKEGKQGISLGKRLKHVEEGLEIAKSARSWMQRVRMLRT